MTQDEEIISNISYTNSDFRSIYPELLDTAKKLTNKWDPSLSNESDPGNILIKEAAIVGDKVNYHIDKNVLECFPLSATQQASARQIYDLVGYNMHWYKSAKGDITLTLLKPLTAINENLGYITIKAGTVFSDTSGEYVYTTLERIQIKDPNVLYKVPAIQGIINPYEINGEQKITIDRLDENLRLYFPQNIIAENGIYVYDYAQGEDNKNINDPADIGYDNDTLSSDSASWKIVDNLTKYPAGSKVFKFGVDLTTDACYIQFPEDVAASNLIGSGLYVYYTTTLGRNGNIKAEIVNKFLSNYDQPINDGADTVTINPYITVSNSATDGGLDPEALEEAYRNYKKLIGTYDTLVTRRDYENAIYNLKSDGLDIVSNSIVTDRTTDMNFSQKVIQTNLSSDYAKNYVVRKYDQSEHEYTDPLMNSYNIVLYMLTKSNSMLTVEDYNTSFKPVLDSDKYIIDEIKESLDEYKSVQHDFNYSSEIREGKNYFNINNMCKLNGVLTTYYKVSKSEATEIENNVIKALVTKYNSREIDFGYELDYNDLINTIKSADDRIRNISLDTLSYEPYMVFDDGSNNQSLYLSGGKSINDETLAKMILAGKVQLFKFQDEFQLDFGQEVLSGFNPTNALSTISTSNPIEIGVDSVTDDKALKKNDIIQIVKPSLVTKETYNATVRCLSNFELKFENTDDGVYILSGSQQLKLLYKDSGTGDWKHKNYLSGSIIKISSTVELKDKIDGLTPNAQQFSDNVSWNSYLTAGQTIEILSLSSISIPAKTPYYVITKDVITESGIKYYKLDLDNATNSKILEEGEYLLYTNPTMDGISILGSGTLIESSHADTILKSPVIEISDIMSADVNTAINSWQRLDIGYNLTAKENEIITLSEGDLIYISNGDDEHPMSPFTCTNNLQPILQNASEKLYYKLKGETGDYIKVSMLGIPGYYVQCRSNMILSGNSIVPQVLEGVQTITIGTTNIQNSIDHIYSILYNYPINIIGGSNVDVKILNESTGEYESKLKLYVYEQGDAVSGDSDIKRNTESGLLTLNDDGELVFKFSETYSLDVANTNLGHRSYYLLPVSCVLDSGVTVTLTLPSGALIGDIISIETGASGITNTYPIGETGSKILAISANSNIQNINVAFTGGSHDNSKISFGYISQIDCLNKDEINVETIGAGNYFKYDLLEETTVASLTAKNYIHVFNKMSEILKSIDNPEFDWVYRVPETNKVIQPLAGNAYFNSNHTYNICTLPKISFDTSSLKVNPSSIK